MRLICQGVHELWSDILTNRQKEITTLYIYKDFNYKQFPLCVHCKTKTIKKFVGFLKFYGNRILFRLIFNFDHLWTLPRVFWGPTNNLGRIRSAVLTYVYWIQTNTHPDRPAKFIDNCWYNELKTLLHTSKKLSIK